MAQLQHIQSHDKRLRADLQELAENLWLGQPVDGQKAGNLRAVFIIFNLPTVASQTFALEHELGEIPSAFIAVGTPTTHVVQLSPGVSGSTRLPWTSNRIYLQSPIASASADDPTTIVLMLWGSDSVGG